jgi:hypothetical protein
MSLLFQTFSTILSLSVIDLLLVQLIAMDDTIKAQKSSMKNPNAIKRTAESRVSYLQINKRR